MVLLLTCKVKEVDNVYLFCLINTKVVILVKYSHTSYNII